MIHMIVSPPQPRGICLGTITEGMFLPTVPFKQIRSLICVYGGQMGIKGQTVQAKVVVNRWET